MITVLSNTARGKALLDRAIRYEGYNLWDVYERFSRAKEKAYEECINKCSEEGGYSFRICGHNTSQFTVSWQVEGGWRMETANNSYLIELVD